MLLSFATSAAEPAAGHASPVHASPEQEIVAAEDIFSQLMIGEPVRYDNVTVAGSLDLAELQGPLPQPVKITNSIFTGPVSFAGASFDQPLDLQGSLFQDNANFAGCRFLGGEIGWGRLPGPGRSSQRLFRRAGLILQRPIR